MRYVFVSDIHGQYEKLMTALDKACFDKNTDTIVSLGDPFDRGPQSKEVLEFLMSCPHRILVWGNHDARLAQLMMSKDFIASYDFSNGVPATLQSLTGLSQNVGVDSIIYLLHYDDQYKDICDLLYKYFHECVWAIEFKDLIATHAWLPTILTDKEINIYGEYVNEKYKLDPDWRKADAETWFDASWSHSQSRWQQKCFPEKMLLIGHWHAWRFAKLCGEDVARYDEFGNIHIDCGTWVSPDGKLVAIDGCSNWAYGGTVNAFIYCSNEKPICYEGNGFLYN